jgi:hypothetical protein
VRPSFNTILSRQYGCRLMPNRPRPLMSICFGPYFSLLTIASAESQRGPRPSDATSCVSTSARTHRPSAAPASCS